MKNKRIAAYLCIAAVFTAAGCAGPQVQSDKQSGEIVRFNDEADTKIPNTVNNQPQTDILHKQPDTAPEQPNAGQTAAAGDDIHSDITQPQNELDGEVETIGDYSIVINKIFHESEEISFSRQDSGKELITVSFSEETKFEVWTVKNGGVNGDSDVEKQQGTFSDIKEQRTVKLTGSYEGNDFHAVQVIIYCFV